METNNSNEFIGKPKITIKDDVYVILIEIADGAVIFRFDSPIYSKNDLEATLLCSVMLAGQHNKDFESRINCLSNSSRESYARQLTLAFGKEIKWVLVLSNACTAFVKAFRDSLTGNVKNKNQIIARETGYLLPPFLEEESSNVLFGKGGSGKTLLALRMAMSMACGVPFLGNLPRHSVATLFLDYEATESVFHDRIEKLAKFCPDWLPSAGDMLFYLHAKGIPFYELQETLKKIIKEKNVGLLIVDSAAMACGDSPEEARNAIRYFNALNALNVTTLTIAHQSKSDEIGAYCFGSVFWHNCARNVWNVNTDNEPDERIIHAGLLHRKSNNDRLRSPIGARIFFDDCGIDINWENPFHCEGEMNTKRRIIRLLGEGPKLLEDISCELDVKKNKVKPHLTQLKNQDKIENTPDHLWKVKEKTPPENPQVSF